MFKKAQDCGPGGRGPWARGQRRGSCTEGPPWNRGQKAQGGVGGVKWKLETAEEKISKCEDMAKETIQHETEKRLNNREQKAHKLA